MSFSFRSGALAAAVVLGIGASLASTVPAAAAPTVGLHCESETAVLSCDVRYADAERPVTIRWSVDNMQRPAWDDLTSVAQRCTVGQTYAVRVVVADPTGRTEAGQRVTCQRATP
ncbi:hypothetical protein [Micromonospora pallida]|uniref:hypothetical protein n=1 Tax=Micromonospora pallida TaxID=145854 RepID=UPI00114D3264|nr:hypothetical protein [Micromonospora pallida]